MKYGIIVAAAVVMSGCTGANISSQLRESGEPGSSKVLRCVDLSTGKFDSSSQGASSSNDTLKKFDGWKLVYVSEYTTPNKTNSAVVMCFEKPFGG